MSMYCMLVFCLLAVDGPNEKPDLEPRKFQLSYGAEITEVPEGATVKVWMPIPQSGGLQKVSTISQKIPGKKLKTSKEPAYGNVIGFFETRSSTSPINFEIVYSVARKEAKPEHAATRKLSSSDRARFLAANKLVPITGEPQNLIKDKTFAGSTMETGLALYDIVETFMTYDKSKPGYGNGDVIWACSSKTGNCTDFHSLFISLARSLQIPARFEIGFPIPNDKKSGTLGGYHCWAWFYTEEQGWVAVDISEADKHPEMKDYYFGRLTPDRVAFSTGRDIQLQPPNNSGPLNYFVYPHVEVDGRIWPKSKIDLKLSFKDLD